MWVSLILGTIFGAVETARARYRDRRTIEPRTVADLESQACNKPKVCVEKRTNKGYRKIVLD